MCCSKKQTQPADGFDQVNFKTITHIHCLTKMEVVAVIKKPNCLSLGEQAACLPVLCGQVCHKRITRVGKVSSQGAIVLG